MRMRMRKKKKLVKLLNLFQRNLIKKKIKYDFMQIIWKRILKNLIKFVGKKNNNKDKDKLIKLMKENEKLKKELESLEQSGSKKIQKI